MYKTIPLRAKFNDEAMLFWVDQCKNSNSLINSALYHVRQNHYERLNQLSNAYTTYWRGDEFCQSWKTYQCNASYAQLCLIFKENEHYRAMAAQSAQQTLKLVVESITSYNGLVKAYYRKEVDKPRLPRYRKRGGLAAVTFPRQALTYRDGYFYPSVSKETKPELLTEIALCLPEFIDSDWVKEVTVRPCYGEFWIDWVIDDGKGPLSHNPDLDYNHAWSFDHGGTNWLTGVLTVTEEAYTSKASFLDGDSLPKHGEKPNGWKASGERVKRGIYKSREGYVVNANCNGSANILRKVATQLSLDLAEVSRGSLTLPQRVNLFSRLSKLYRKRCEVGFLNRSRNNRACIRCVSTNGDVKIRSRYD